MAPSTDGSPRLPIEPKTAGRVRSLEDHLRTEYSTFTWILEPMLERSRFAIRETNYNDAGAFADYLCERLIGVSR